MKRHSAILLWMISSCATNSNGVRATSAESAITVAGARCEGGACTCRGSEGAGDSEGTIAAGQKRFELRTGYGVDPLRVTVEGRGTLVKSVDAGRAQCAYIDLPPGRHKVHLHAQAKNPDAGMAPSLSISEYGERTHSWYDTFRFDCGQNEPCTKDDLNDFIAALAKDSRGIHDPCGSVRVEGVRWSAERSPGTRLEDLDLDLVLDVYPFAPRFPHGQTCKGVSETPQTGDSGE